MKNKIDKMVEKLGKSFQVFNKRRHDKPVDVMALVVDLANAEKAYTDGSNLAGISRGALLKVLKARGVQCLVVPANPDGTEVFVAYIYQNIYPGQVGNSVDYLRLDRVKVEAA